MILLPPFSHFVSKCHEVGDFSLIWGFPVHKNPWYAFEIIYDRFEDILRMCSLCAAVATSFACNPMTDTPEAQLYKTLSFGSIRHWVAVNSAHVVP